MDFKNITLGDKKLIQTYTFASQLRNCGLSFVNLMSWNFLYHTQYAVNHDFLVLRVNFNGKISYFPPVGKGDFQTVLNEMIADSESLGVPFCLYAVSSTMKDVIETMMPGRFKFVLHREYSDYIYLRNDLATLKGNKLQPKRNHVNKFMRAYPQFTYHELTPEFVPQCLDFERKWEKQNTTPKEMQALEDERHSMTFALNNFATLELRGGFICVDGKMVAFTFGAPINNSTFDVCVEKADTEFDGAYAMINYEFSRRIPENFIFINREEDLGIEGLRKAKLSYQPYEILDNYMARLL